MKLDAIRPKMLAAVAAVIIVIVTAGIFVAKKLAPSTEKDVQWKTYTDASYEFSLKFPDSWSFTSVEPEDEDILASYILTDPSVITPQQEQQVLAAVHVNTRPYIQVVNRVESDLVAVSCETVTIRTADGKEVTGTRYTGNKEILTNPMDATVIPMSGRTLVVYSLSNSELYTEILNIVASTITLE